MQKLEKCLFLSGNATTPSQSFANLTKCWKDPWRRLYAAPVPQKTLTFQANLQESADCAPIRIPQDVQRSSIALQFSSCNSSSAQILRNTIK
ncbi:predicted protein [Sclerotinia sclerotiorum 1980 UF-70]|uniref:Uncharacterized protein n=1 Tax=Sclerotinia sclerotiorum (strain ATCC 18683 / 1980 / Ss-1) TaxID=665079 RepID=A7E9F8_SCLS1|nr:predicted protein [Sclerotinia sclerotiorum 1980 UF-70]EDN97010.1 predicted protein [Sclerotinia sclerotiorum 1980 UF-70]